MPKSAQLNQKKAKKKKRNKEQMFLFSDSKMVELNQTISITTLNVKGLYTQKHKLSDWLKNQDPTLYHL